MSESTTGHAVLKLNAEDGGHRRFILCTNNKNSICCDITYERLRTVITGKRKDGSEYSEGLPGSLAVTILGKLFANEGKFLYKEKLLELSIKNWYAFAINNFDELRHAFRFAMSQDAGLNQALGLETVSEKPFFIPPRTATREMNSFPSYMCP